MDDEDSKPASTPNSAARADTLDEIQRALSRLFRLIHTRPNSSSDLLTMPVVQLRCLNAIAEREGQKLGEIAERVELGLPNVSRAVDQLVRRGLVNREPAPGDRRALRLSLTDRARALLAQLHSARVGRLEVAARFIEDDHLARIRESLGILVQEAERHAGETGPVFPPPESLRTDL